MEACISKLKYHFIARSHLHTLLPSEPFTFCICTEKDSWIIQLSKDGFSYEKSNQADEIATKIITVSSVAFELLKGKVRLSKLKKYNDIVYEGSFRHFLLLESILWLCRDYEKGMEAISV
ncbi:hypothetical protein [Heyndrickxia camelliae]|uniref:SCP2 domain-containing protein n=1 Tax=Heyndrickxia camelliae TaxID=1707093 RepID=A0A2N3LH48_9BACI|nr:hypothetical protein [Heyndrickxia camelliae]PKR83909.1 hypothetical protein CWO92_16775 [Heyndrickxia camelliae]